MMGMYDTLLGKLPCWRMNGTMAFWGDVCYVGQYPLLG